MATWPSTQANALLSGQGVEAEGRDIFDRLAKSFQIGGTMKFSGSQGAASWATVDTIYVRAPEAILSGWKLVVGANVTSGTQFRAVVNGVTTGTATASGGVGESEVTAPDDTWAGTTLEVAIQCNASDVDTVGLIGNICWIEV